MGRRACSAPRPGGTAGTATAQEEAPDEEGKERPGQVGEVVDERPGETGGREEEDPGEHRQEHAEYHGPLAPDAPALEIGGRRLPFHGRGSGEPT